MRPVAQAASTAARSWTRYALPQSSRVAATSLTASTPESQRRLASTATSEPSGPTSFDSPFGSSQHAASPSTKVPSFKAYMSKSSENTNRVFQYFMVGTMGLLSAAGAKATVQGMDNQRDGAAQRAILSSKKKKPWIS